MISSRRAGIFRFSRSTGTGARFRMASKTRADVSPWNGNTPVAISYSTAPKGNRSVRAEPVTFSRFSFFLYVQPDVLNPKQNRHPERSATQIYRIRTVYRAQSKDPGHKLSAKLKKS